MAVLQSTVRSLALARVDTLIGRAFSIVALITGVEMLANALPQVQYLDPIYTWTSLGLIIAVQAFNVYNFWFGSGSLWGYTVHSAVVLFVMLVWPVLVPDVASLPEDYRPWVWWATGIASMAVGMHIPKWWAWGYMVSIPLVWFFLHTQPTGGSAAFSTALQDASYIVLFPATVVTLAQLLRSSAAKVDVASAQATAAAADRARTDAIERERSRIDALVHDSVLTTLIVAANANSDEQYAAASESAREAIWKLKSVASDPETKSESISVISFFQALGESVRRQDAACELAVSGASAKQLPAEVVDALTDATAQAVANSIQHAGRGAQRLLRLKATERELKIVVRDDGVGFRPSRVPKNRLGLRISITDRVESVGGKVFIDSRLGGGTSIVIEWPFND
jgi:signal transduction histidine kinase